MTTTDTPRTDSCPYCGAEDYDPEYCDFLCDTRFYPKTNTFIQSRLCAERKKSQKLNAEVERLKANLNRTIKIALMIWGDKPCDKDWPELRVELEQIKATLNPTDR